MKLIPSPGQGCFGASIYSRLHQSYPYFLMGSDSTYIRIAECPHPISGFPNELRFYRLDRRNGYTTIEEWMDAMQEERREEALRLGLLHEQELNPVMYRLVTSCSLPKLGYRVQPSPVWHSWPTCYEDLGALSLVG